MGHEKIALITLSDRKSKNGVTRLVFLLNNRMIKFTTHSIIKVTLSCNIPLCGKFEVKKRRVFFKYSRKI